MSDGFSMKLGGLSALQAQLVDLGAELGQKALAQAARKAFKPVLETAKRLVPRDTGDLAEAIKLSVKKPGSGDAVVVVGLRIGRGKISAPGKLPPSARWHFIELGTVKLAAHPFLRPALDGNATAVLEQLKVELVKSIEKVRRKRK